MKQKCFILSLLISFVTLFFGSSNTSKTTIMSSSTSPSFSDNTISKTNISVTHSSLNVFPGQNATISIKTKAGALATIEVTYPYGKGKLSELVSKTADGRGMINWTWKIGVITHSGTYPVIISMNGSTITEKLTVYKKQD